MKYVYLFNEGNKDMRELLGGKGANLAEMTNMNFPVPKGFTITTEACNLFYKNNEKLADNIIKEIKEAIKKLENATNKEFGGVKKPLLLSVRSGARSSMPGMMDSILNLGINDEVCLALAKITNNKKFAYDSYRRFITMYSDVVKGLDRGYFEKYISLAKEKYGVNNDSEIPEEAMIKMAKDFKKIYQKLTHEEFPQDPFVQLENAIYAVFKSWNNERAIYYRKLNNIPDSWGTAVNIQEMVYGNIGDNSLTGVAFSRNPATGEKGLFGEYLDNAQGEDVVAGIRTPKSITELKKENPSIYEEFKDIAEKLEKHYKDMQDMEFTVENNKLYILQTRIGKRTGAAALKIALDLIREGIITYEDAIERITKDDIESLLHETIEGQELDKNKPIAKGLPASPGAGSGAIYFDSESILKHSKEENTILVRLETSPEDIVSMKHAKGIMTIRGGMTSHAAVVARGMGICCVSGCEEVIFDEVNKELIFKDGEVLKEGEQITLDGSTGLVYKGILKKAPVDLNSDLRVFMKILEKYEGIKVRANADNASDAKIAFKFGASGIGLCRTEHMFFSDERIFSFRKMILASTKEERKKALLEILPYQKQDFKEIFMAAQDKSVIVRYLDPPLHEFLPKEEEEITKLAKDLNKKEEDIKKRIAGLKEFNPMMGHRGCRLLITYPEIIVMQTESLIGAAIEVAKSGITIKPEIMIPLVTDTKEFIFIKNIVDKTAKALMNKNNIVIDYKVGTMIETPRAALLAYDIASKSEFFSFGTNDLTQMTYGFSRDDAGKFLPDYYDKNIFSFDPFITFDKSGIGKLIEGAIKTSKKIKPDLEVGICGEHGGDLESVMYFSSIGLDYVSCSPYRVPVARLASAKANIYKKKNK